MTRVVKVDSHNIDASIIDNAAQLLKSGKLVVFPTETVYGVATTALNENAAASVFECKKRSADVPLPVQISSADLLDSVAVDLNEGIRRVARSFWPGPLTIVLRKSSNIPSIVSAGTETVGIRIPDHPVALAILRKTVLPLVVTSANLSGSPAPVTAEEAAEQLDGRVDLIIDSGPCKIGIASTVIDLSCSAPVVLREGSISLQEILNVLNAEGDNHGRYKEQ